MSDRTRKCPFAGCNNFVRPEFFACSGHWYSLSKSHKAAVHRIYGQWQRGDIDGDELMAAQQRVLDEHYASKE